jgi:hypothetical protein
MFTYAAQASRCFQPRGLPPSNEDWKLSGKTQQRQKLGKGPENIGSEKMGEKIGKTRQTLKNT